MTTGAAPQPGHATEQAGQPAHARCTECRVTGEERATHLVALTIATHRISPRRADLIAADVTRELARIGWGGRPDAINFLQYIGINCATCSGLRIGIRWDYRANAYVPTCRRCLDADGATGGAG